MVPSTPRASLEFLELLPLAAAPQSPAMSRIVSQNQGWGSATNFILIIILAECLPLNNPLPPNTGWFRMKRIIKILKILRRRRKRE